MRHASRGISRRDQPDCARTRQRPGLRPSDRISCATRPVGTRLRATLTQLGQPLLVILIFAAVASLATGEWIDAAIVRTARFVESLLTELVIALVVRARRPCFRSRPGTLLLASTVVLVIVTFIIPYLPLVSAIGFVPLPPAIVGTLCAITVLYVLATEAAKRWFFAPRP
jgi:magnesium-transporting ATPase (P-type)